MNSRSAIGTYNGNDYIELDFDLTMFLMSGMWSVIDEDEYHRNSLISGVDTPVSETTMPLLSDLTIDSTGTMKFHDRVVNVFELEEKVQRLEAIVEAQKEIIDSLLDKRDPIRRIRRG